MTPSPTPPLPGSPPRPEHWYLAFALAVFVFHQLPAFAGDAAGDAIDILTPWAVVGASVGLLVALGAPRSAALLALLAGLLYVQGQGIHLAANSIHNAGPVGAVEEITYFWDERFSHVETLLGWLGLLAAFCLAERDRPWPGADGPVLPIAAAVLGWTLFTSTVEGQTWPLELVAAVAFGSWALRSRGRSSPRPLLVATALGLAVGAALIAIWALLNGGVPEFSDAGLI